jgi:hypothetical protein
MLMDEMGPARVGPLYLTLTEMETKQQKSLRAMITVFMALIAILIMVVIQDTWERIHHRVTMVVVRRVHDTVVVTKPITIVVDGKTHQVSVIPTIQPDVEKFTVLTDNGDIAKSLKHRPYDKSGTD